MTSNDVQSDAGNSQAEHPRGTTRLVVRKTRTAARTPGGTGRNGAEDEHGYLRGMRRIVDGKRADARWCSGACRMKAKRREARRDLFREMFDNRAELLPVRPEESRDADERFRTIMAASQAAEDDRASRTALERGMVGLRTPTGHRAPWPHRRPPPAPGRRPCAEVHHAGSWRTRPRRTPTRTYPYGWANRAGRQRPGPNGTSADDRRG
jgi:hypothetical protein